MKTITLNRFDGGVTNDPKTPSANHARAVANFDILTDPYRLIPYRDSEDGDSSASTQKIRNFVVGSNAGTATIYGLGVDGSNNIAIYNRSLSDLDDATWGATSNNVSSGGLSYPEFFTYYARLGMIFGVRAATNIFEYDTDGGTAFNNADLVLAETATSFSNGIVHPKDDILYVGYNNYIIKNNNGTWTDPALTLPKEMKVTSIADYGNFIAVGCSQVNGLGRAQVYLWDRDSSLATLSESISWGDENLVVLEEIEGELVGVSLSNSAADLTQKVIFRRYVTGVGAVKFLELTIGSPTVTTVVSRRKQKFGGRLYFMMNPTINGSVRGGVWSIGRSSRTREWTLVHERTSDNDTALANSQNLEGFVNVGNFLFQAHQDNGTYEMTKTNDAVSYTATSYYETTINPGMPLEDMFRKKKLYSITCHYEAQPTAGQVVVKYRTDRNSSYTTVFTDTTNSGTSFEMVNAAGTSFTDGREFEFRIESTGGTVITGLTYKYDTLETNQ